MFGGRLAHNGPAGLPTAPLPQTQIETMSETINDKQSTEDGGAVGKPAVLRRSFFSKVREWFTGRTELVPLCYGQPGCPELKVGDVLVGITEGRSKNYIAGLCGLPMDTPEGNMVEWKVADIMSSGSVMIESGSARTFLDWCKWEDGNRITIPAGLAYSQILVRWYKRVRI
jgi:hypothetical protein